MLYMYTGERLLMLFIHMKRYLLTESILSISVPNFS